MKHRNARFNADGSIDAEIQHRDYGWIPITAAAGAEGLPGEVFDLLKNHKDTEPHRPPSAEQLAAAAMAEARAERDRRLAKHVDTWNPVSWHGLSEAEKAKWADYRQELLDVPAQAGFPTDIDWPKKPNDNPRAGM